MVLTDGRTRFLINSVESEVIIDPDFHLVPVIFCYQPRCNSKHSEEFKHIRKGLKAGLKHLLGFKVREFIDIAETSCSFGNDNK